MSVTAAGSTPSFPDPGGEPYEIPAPATRPPFGANTPVHSGADSRAAVLAQLAASSAPAEEIANEPAATPDQVGEWKPAAGALFAPGGPRYTDIAQGHVADCWLMASLAAVAYKDPEVLERMIRSNADGSVDVTFQEAYDDPDTLETKFKPVSVNVKPDLLVDAGDGKSSLYADPAPGGKQVGLWAAIIEKAYAEWKGGYGSLEGGVADDAMAALTGEEAKPISVNDATDLGQLYSSIRGAIWSGSPVVAATRAQTDGSVVHEHGYMVVDAWEQGGKQYVGLYNPFGQDGQKLGIPQYVTLPIDQFRKNMSGVTIGEPT